MDVLDDIEVAFHEAVRKNQLRKMMQNGMRELPAAEAPSPYGGPEALRDLHVALSGPNSTLLSPDLVDMFDMNDEVSGCVDGWLFIGISLCYRPRNLLGNSRNL